MSADQLVANVKEFAANVGFFSVLQFDDAELVEAVEAANATTFDAALEAVTSTVAVVL